MKIFSLALSFLTIIPAFGDRQADENDMAASLYLYPLVGFLIGAALAFLAWFFQQIHLGWGGDAIIVTAWILISGGLHLDGLMDSADGLFSGRERARKLEIMKDSRVGAMGSIALVAVLLLKFALLTSLPYPERLGVLLVAPALGRCVMVYAVVMYPYARAVPGLGSSFGAEAGMEKIVGAGIMLLVGTWASLGLSGLIFLAAAAGLAVLVAMWINSSLGGHTGDTYGALCETAETLFLLTTAVGMAAYTLL